MKVITKCKKCPDIKGDTFCGQFEKKIWKEDEMCPYGYRIRILRGVEKACKIFNEDTINGLVRSDSILEQVKLLEEAWEQRWVGTQEDNSIYEFMKEVKLYGDFTRVEEQALGEDVPF